MSRDSQNLLASIVATVIYGAFAYYLYEPYFSRFTRWQWFLPFGLWIAAMGGFFLSRRWVAGLFGSILAGAVYGFGPFVLSLTRYHPTVALLAASMPWLFMPAAFVDRKRHSAVAAALSLLPFLVVLLFFRLGATETLRLFAAPIQMQPKPIDLVGFLVPKVMVNRTAVLASLYHIPIAPLVIGLAIMVKSRRYGVTVIATLGLALAFGNFYLPAAHTAWLTVSPILWLSIPLLVLAVLTGVGYQGLIEAGPSDRKWVLAAAIVQGCLAIVALLLAAKYFQVRFGLADGYARLFVDAAKMYLIAAMTLGVLFVITRQKLRLQWFRQAALIAVLALDIFLAARYLVDKIL